MLQRVIITTFEAESLRMTTVRGRHVDYLGRILLFSPRIIVARYFCDSNNL